MSRTRIYVPFPAAKTGFSKLPASEQILPESKPAMQWLTKYDSAWQAIFDLSANSCTLLIQKWNHKSRKLM
jgi:hypothetical protein